MALPPEARDPAWVGRFLARIRARGTTASRERYARPEAGGETCAWRLTPMAPRARLVYAHATGNDALYPQLALYETLLAAGIEVFAFDLDGHGRGSTTRLEPRSVRTCVRAGIAAATRERPELPLHLAGQSLGAALCLDAAAEDGCGAQTLSLVSAPLELSLSAFALASELRTLLRPAFFGQIGIYGLGGVVPAMGPVKRGSYPVRLGSADVAGATAAPDYAVAAAHIVAALDLRAQARRIRMPTLLVYGARDRLVPLEQGRELAALVPGARLLVVAGATHFTTPFEAGVAEAITSLV